MKLFTTLLLASLFSVGAFSATHWKFGVVEGGKSERGCFNKIIVAHENCLETLDDYFNNNDSVDLNSLRCSNKGFHWSGDFLIKYRDIRKNQCACPENSFSPAACLARAKVEDDTVIAEDKIVNETLKAQSTSMFGNNYFKAVTNLWNQLSDLSNKSQIVKYSYQGCSYIRDGISCSVRVSYVQ